MSSSGSAKRTSICLVSLALMLVCLSFGVARGQGSQTLYGDFKVDESKAGQAAKPISYDLILYYDTGVIAGRQTVSNGGRYRFVNMPNGVYFLAVELENNEVARIRVELLRSNYKADHRQDVELTLQALPGAAKSTKAVNISVDDFYNRTAANQKRFEKAQSAADSKKYAEAVTGFKSLVADDPNDFQAFTELGTVYLAQKSLSDAESAYLQATKIKPGFFLALLNLGRVRLMENNYEGAIEALTKAIESKSTSAPANYYLGEAYLQNKKGSKAVTYFYEALKLDPVGMAEAHLRLATLYNAVGLKDKAAFEYEQFLKKVPDYPDKKKLQDYVTANKKP
jgi:tetratricopeptide (TPR) repeat protein